MRYAKVQMWINLRFGANPHYCKPWPNIDRQILNNAAETTFPGAIQAGVANYIRNSLLTAYEGDIPAYREGLKQIDELSFRKFGQSFEKLGQQQRETVLQQIEDSAFFETLRQHTMEGMFSDPIHGGNRNKLDWRLIGFPGARFHPDHHISRGWRAKKFISLKDKRELRENER